MGQQAWAEIQLSYEEFEAHAASFGHSEVPAHAADLYLTAACRLGRRAAIQILEKEYVQRARPLVLSVVRDVSAVEDILQDLFTRLVVGPPPKVARFRGTGPLRAWIRSVALNVARDYLRTATSRRRAEAAKAKLLPRFENSTPNDILTVPLHGEHRDTACLDAVRVAFETLQPFERQLLHEHYIEGLSIDDLAPRCLVNRATVARRIRRAVDKVAKQARKRLAMLYPREDDRGLNALALATCLERLIDPMALLDAPELAMTALARPSDAPTRASSRSTVIT
jgi:RNA polymerase sigma-70 factor